MNYFDGWSGPLSNTHFGGLVRRGPNGIFPGRRPLSGWRDQSRASLRVSLEWARKAGIDFFYFDWYYRPERFPEAGPVNTALANYRRLADHHGVDYALMYVNHDPWEIPAGDWVDAVHEWVTKDFVDRDYARVDGKPILFILDSLRFTAEHGGTAGVNAALGMLRREAVANGLPGVFVVGSVARGILGDATQSENVAHRLAGQEYDALTQFAYPAVTGLWDGPRPYADVSAVAPRIWDWYATWLGYKTIPAVMDGWDPRPWDVRFEGHLWWFERTPQEVATTVREAIMWATDHPEERVDARPIVLAIAWNELGEGQYLIPTRGDGYTYLRALARANNVPWTRPHKNELAVTITGGGTVTIGPTGNSCRRRCIVAADHGWELRLFATPDRGHRFVGWRGRCQHAGRRCAFILERRSTVRAAFTRG